MNEMQKAKLEWLRSEIQKGLDDVESGRFRDGPSVMAEMREKLLNLKARRDKEIENDQTL